MKVRSMGGGELAEEGRGELGPGTRRPGKLGPGALCPIAPRLAAAFARAEPIGVQHRGRELRQRLARAAEAPSAGSRPQTAAAAARPPSARAGHGCGDLLTGAV